MEAHMLSCQHPPPPEVSKVKLQRIDSQDEEMFPNDGLEMGSHNWRKWEAKLLSEPLVHF